jgi:hypothetical protein
LRQELLDGQLQNQDNNRSKKGLNLTLTERKQMQAEDLTNKIVWKNLPISKVTQTFNHNHYLGEQ